MNLKSLIAPIGIILTIVLLGDLNAPTPILFLYIALAFTGFLIPLKKVTNKVAFWFVGVVSIFVGIWGYIDQLYPLLTLVLFLVLGISSLLLPKILPSKIIG